MIGIIVLVLVFLGVIMSVWNLVGIKIFFVEMKFLDDILLVLETFDNAFFLALLIIFGLAAIELGIRRSFHRILKEIQMTNESLVHLRRVDKNLRRIEDILVSVDISQLEEESSGENNSHHKPKRGSR
jgi:hypothetical protein